MDTKNNVEINYKAFLSYSREDEKVASWLHRELDRFVTPKQLRAIIGSYGVVPDKLHPIFMDKSDLPSGGVLNERIITALRNSDALIVLCSTSASKSKWVDTEVQEFIQLGRQHKIFPIITSTASSSDNFEEDFFPPSLRGLGLLAADLRSIKSDSGKIIGDTIQLGKLKLIAGLYGIELNSLIQRERLRQNKITTMMLALVITFALITSTSVGLYFQSNKRLKETKELEKRQRSLTKIAETKSKNLTNSVMLYRELIKEQADPHARLKIRYMSFLGSIELSLCTKVATKPYPKYKCRPRLISEMNKKEAEYFTILRDSLTDYKENPTKTCFGTCNVECNEDSPYFVITRLNGECTPTLIKDLIGKIFNLYVFKTSSGNRTVLSYQITTTNWGRPLSNPAMPVAFIAGVDGYYQLTGILMYVGSNYDKPFNQSDDTLNNHDPDDSWGEAFIPDVIVRWLRGKDLPDFIVGDEEGAAASTKTLRSMFYRYDNNFRQYSGFCLANGRWDDGDNRDSLLNLADADLKNCSLENDNYDLGETKSEDLDTDKTTSDAE